MIFDLEAWLQPRRQALEAHLASRFRRIWPPAFAEPLRYPLGTGGKRIRPALVYAAQHALGRGVDFAPAVAAAAAVELVHTYSLVHDDLPAMDDDDERRGRPTVHVAFGEATAVLVGDALLTEAFAVIVDSGLSAETRIAQIACLARASGHAGMVGGQAADVAGGVTSLDVLEQLHAGKTGALIAASCVLGAHCGGGTRAEIDRLAAYGRAVGLAFQLADDVLDADEDVDGPPSFVQLLGIDATRERASILVDEAIAQIADLPRPEPLTALARFTVERDI